MPALTENLRSITLFAPEITGHTATFRWAIEPDDGLYKRPFFTTTFPATIDISRVSKRLWFDIQMLCLHQHWLLMRPCVIKLPYKLTEPEKQFWLRMMQHALDTLETVHQTGAPDQPLGIRFIDGPEAAPHERIVGGGFGAAFSSGKDSLLQASLLFELTGNPLLVTTTSPLPPLEDHQNARRGEIFSAIQKRRNPVFVEVVSDFRSNWENGYPYRRGFAISVNELTDTFLYMANLLAVAAALGRTNLFLASEAEVQENAKQDGKIVQHPHFMYSAATQRAFARYLEPHGLRFGSLIWPLYSMQVQQLLWARYPDLSDLQYSCWRVTDGERTCSRCEQCMRTALTALAAGHDPQRMGINLRKLMAHAHEWTPIEPERSGPNIPQHVAAQRARMRVVSAIRNTSALRLAATAIKARPSRLFSRKTWRMVRRFGALRERVADLPGAPQMGVREAYFDWLDPQLRDQLIAIFTSQFPREPKAEHIDAFERSNRLVDLATAGLLEVRSAAASPMTVGAKG